MTQQVLPVSTFQVPQDVEGKDNPVPEATDKNFKAVRNIPAHNDASGLISGLRESYLPQSFKALDSRFKIPVQEEFISC